LSENTKIPLFSRFFGKNRPKTPKTDNYASGTRQSPPTRCLSSLQIPSRSQIPENTKNRQN
jgi:hypothetical protein